MKLSNQELAELRKRVNKLSDSQLNFEVSKLVEAARQFVGETSHDTFSDKIEMGSDGWLTKDQEIEIAESLRLQKLGLNKAV